MNNLKARNTLVVPIDILPSGSNTIEISALIAREPTRRPVGLNDCNPIPTTIICASISNQRTIMDPRTVSGSSRHQSRRHWFRDKTNVFLFSVATLSFVGIAVACLGAFALGSALIAVSGSIMVTVAALLWVVWTVIVTLQVVFRTTVEQTSDDPSRASDYHKDNPAGSAP